MLRLLLLAWFTVAASVRGESITVCAAASLKEVMADLGKAYKQEAGDEVKFVFGASGTLAAQIRNGAPADLFISAAERQIKDLTAAKLADGSTRCVVATNTLVIIKPAGGGAEVKDVAALADGAVKKIAVGDPKIVPAGEYAAQAFKKAKIDDKLANKLVYAASVRQVLAYVERGEVDAGVVYETDAKLSGDKVKILLTVPADLLDRIEYPAVMLTGSTKPAAAKKFLGFLSSEKAKWILKDRGFKPADTEGRP